jgi:2-desacetyl-2-hydroxyethyl bacteriochlorophyllide A dehydrogenase
MMKAAILTDVQQIEIRQTAIPIPSANQALVKVEKTGICGSDLSTYLGQHPYKTAPTVLGHEFCGTITQLGNNVAGFSLGDRVCSAAYANCNQCEFCWGDRHHLCTNKTAFSFQGWDGSFAEYVIVKPEKLYRLSQQIDPALGALVEPLSIALHALQLTSIENKNVLIIGSGCIGLATIINAKKLAAKKITAIDIQEQKQSLALACGADEFYASVAPIRQQADVTIVAASYDGAIDDAIAATVSGGTVCVVAYFSTPLNCNFNELVKREITLTGSALSEDRDFLTIIEWIENSEIDPSPLITHEYSLQETHRAMQLMASTESPTGKIMLSINDKKDE